MGFYKSICDVCFPSKETWHYKESGLTAGHCCDHSNYDPTIKVSRPNVNQAITVLADLHRNKIDQKVATVKYQTPVKSTKRQSILTKRRYQVEPTHQCVGCKKEVSPGLCRTGKVLVDMSWTTIEKQVLTSLYPVQYGVSEKRVKLPTYKSGFLCDLCASNYSVIQDVTQDGRLIEHPQVIIDPLPGYNTTIQDVRNLDDLGSTTDPNARSKFRR